MTKSVPWASGGSDKSSPGIRTGCPGFSAGPQAKSQGHYSSANFHYHFLDEQGRITIIRTGSSTIADHSKREQYILLVDGYKKQCKLKMP
jgi:hypothetical protein